MTKTPSSTSLPPSSSPEQPEGFDPFSFNQQMREILERLSPLMKGYAEKQGEDLAQKNWDPYNLHPVLMSFWQNSFQNPQNFMNLQMEYWQNMALLVHEMGRRFMGDEHGKDIAESDKGDRRFRDPLWKENMVFDFLRQSYLLTSEWMKKSIHNTKGLKQQDKARLDFYTRQFVDAIAPSNFAMTNPEVIRETINSHGQNLLKGLENLAEDLERGKGELEISKTNYQAFKVGKNLALTPGDVIFENELLQLIQYAPSTKEVYKTPLLIVSPWINKYYILDLRPDNSFVKWAVDQGHTVFIISWVNPDKKLSQKTFTDYIEEGLFEAMDAVTKATGEKKMNVIGYCIGGTLLTAAMAYISSAGLENKIASATLLTTLIDFSDAGDLSIFVDDEQLKFLDEKMGIKGYLEGSNLRNTFSMLRANDLIWSFVVNNYMLGKEPFPFDLLYWNDDSTNMPATMHSYYLRNMYRDNLLAKAGGIKINNVPIDVRKIKTPVYFISTKEDHIAPWKATYEGMMLFSGKKKFVLSASGHVAGVVNPPAANKYHYWENDTIDERHHAQTWLKNAQQRDGSWWTNWATWIKETSGPKVPARSPSKDGKLKAIEPAPGRYVMKKAE